MYIKQEVIGISFENGLKTIMQTTITTALMTLDIVCIN